MAGEVLGIDVGGSSVKAGLVDPKAGRLAGELIAAPTPRPSTPVAVTNVLAALAGRLPASAGRVGVAFPSVIKEGTAYTAANIDAAWVGTDGASLASQALGRPVLFLNDADAAGLAELRGMDAEKWTSARVRTAENLDFPAWIERVNEYLAEMHRLFWPDVFILGGAVSERFAEFAPLLRPPGRQTAPGAVCRPGG